MTTRNGDLRSATTAWTQRVIAVAVVVLSVTSGATAQTYSSTFPSNRDDAGRRSDRQERGWNFRNTLDRENRDGGRFRNVTTRRLINDLPTDGRFPDLGDDDSLQQPVVDPRLDDRLYDRLQSDIELRSREFDALRGRPSWDRQLDDLRLERAPRGDRMRVVPRSFERRDPSDFPELDRRDPRDGFDRFPNRLERDDDSPRIDERLGVPGFDGRRRDDRLPNDARPLPSSPTEDNVSETQKRQMKIAARYGNPVVQRFVQGVPAQQGLRLYQEAMQLIDSRHLQPTPYDVRVREGLVNLSMAVESPAFQQANRVSLNAQQVRSLQTALGQLGQRQVRSSAEAVNLLQTAMQMAGQQGGIQPAAVAMEFVCGSTDSLDKYSSFMPEENAPRPSAAILDDHVVGIGVEIMPHEQGAAVKRVLPGGPAAEAGLQAGDLLVAVNGRNLKGQSMDFAVDLITGAAGTPVQLSLVRGNRSPSTVTLTRRQVKVASVTETRMLDPQNGIGYIKLEKFAQASEEEVDQALWSLHQQGMQSLIFDLRGNPGGLLNVAVALSDKFLPGGTIVSTRGRTQADNTAELARRERTWKTPLVVLIDGESASASEIFAAAIQDNGRGVVVGRKSYGKGTVQTHFPLQTVNGYLKLTTAKFYSPSGREIAAQGVQPDVYVAEARRAVGNVSLESDSDVIAAVQAARNPRTRELANSPGQNMAQPQMTR